MEFERAIFRVYERCIEGLRDDDTETISSKSCRAIELITFLSTLFFLTCLIYLHVSFIGSSGCLPQLLAVQNLTHFPTDAILHINIDPKFTTDEAGVNDSGINDDMFSSKPKRLRVELPRHVTRYHPFTKRIFPYDLSSGNETSPTTNSTVTNEDEYFDYEFSFNVAELLLPLRIRKSHNFKVYNVSMYSEQCFGSQVTRYILPLGGLDTVVVNNLMYTFHKSGNVISSAGDYYRWSKSDVERHTSFGDYVFDKFFILLSSCFLFFLLSTITALLVRVLISSGVVLLLPIFSLFELCGVRLISSHIIRLSYPWIGVPLEMLRIRNQSTVPFLIAHCTRVVVYYVFYEACQIAFSGWFYGQQQPGQRELWLFGIMMLWEYYGMIYVRAKNSILLYPRSIFGLFLLFHFYIYAQPFGFHILALLIMFLASLCVMIYCVRVYELQAYFRGIVNIDQPRMLYNTVPWPTWSNALAPDFTLFLPITQVATGLYNQVVPDRDEELGSGGSAGGTVDRVSDGISTTNTQINPPGANTAQINISAEGDDNASQTVSPVRGNGYNTLSNPFGYDDEVKANDTRIHPNTNDDDDDTITTNRKASAWIAQINPFQSQISKNEYSQIDMSNAPNNNGGSVVRRNSSSSNRSNI